MRWIIIMAALAALTGCAGVTNSLPLLSNGTSPTKVYDFQKPVENGATINISLTASMDNMSCDALVSVDGQKAALLDPGQTANLYVTPGAHAVRVAIDSTLCHPGHGGIQVHPRAGETAYLNAALRGRGVVALRKTNG